jgi:hypothetical protein
MALMPFYKNGSGITGALAQGEIYQPSKHGVLIYLAADDINACMECALKKGGKLLFPRTIAKDYGYVAEMEDSEGNRIGLLENARRE